MLDRNSVHSLIFTPTRENAILDNILSNDPNSIVDCGVIDPGLSDHSACYIRRNFKAIKLSPITMCKRHYDRIDYAQLGKKVISSNFCSTGDLTERVEHFMRMHVNIFDEFAPIKKHSFVPKANPIRLSDSTKHILSERKLYVSLKKKDVSAMEKYKIVNAMTKKAIRTDTKDSLSNLMKEKGVWHVINKLKKPCTSTDFSHSADDFNRYFSSINNCDVMHYDIDSTIAKDNEPTFCLKPISLHLLFQQWKGIKKKQNPCPDLHGFASKMLHYTIGAPNVHDTLLSLVNDSILTNTYPHCFKTSTVVPIPKIKNPSLVAHYRPISLQSQLSKLLKKRYTLS